MRAKKDLLARFGERLDIPREALPGGFGAMLAGENELTVRGCRRIIRYGVTEIALGVGKTALTVRGERLLCAAFGAGCVTVTGRIVSLALGEVEE